MHFFFDLRDKNHNNYQRISLKNKYINPSPDINKIKPFLSMSIIIYFPILFKIKNK